MKNFDPSNFTDILFLHDSIRLRIGLFLWVLSYPFFDYFKNSTEPNIIAKNTGINADIIKQIKEHIFVNEHIVWDGIKRFDPDIDIGNAWERLVSNTFLKSDLELLKHEYAESIIMGKCTVSWRKAHDITDKVYNWAEYLEGKI